LELNQQIQQATNPEKPGTRQITIGEKLFRQGDRVIQTRNNYDLGVFNDDIGRIQAIDPEDYSCRIHFGSSGQVVTYPKEDLTELALAYAVTIHKSQGSEFETVIIPVHAQHFKMLFRNLIYTAVTRAKKLEGSSAIPGLNSKMPFSFLLRTPVREFLKTNFRASLIGFGKSRVRHGRVPVWAFSS
jgi:exodeoxyribonuclease V alpha subunit